MASIAFIGLGDMGLQMANNLLMLGHAVTGYDLREARASRLAEQGGRAAENPVDAVSNADFIISMMADGAAVKAFYLENTAVKTAIKPGAIVIDCSTIGVEETRSISSALEMAEVSMLDAPVIGDARDARVRLLTFAVGGSTAAFTEAQPILSDMGERVVHCGKSGAGQAAVLCTQMMTAINVMAAAEAFALAEREGLASDKLFEVAAMTSASSWALIDRCPQSGLVPAAPSNNMYQAGLAAQHMLRFLRLVEEVGLKTNSRIPLTGQAIDLFAEFCDTHDPRLDFSAVIQVLRRR